MISELLREFTALADTHTVGDSPFGSPKEIVLKALGSTTYQSLDVKGSFGQGRATAVPWIGFFGYKQRTEKGVYPVYLYFKAQKIIVLAYGISETFSPEKSWDLKDERP